MPRTVSNFVDLAARGFYDGLSFHRVIPDFMIQCGCPHSRDPASALAGTGGPAPDSTYRNLLTGESITRSASGCIQDEFTCELSNLPGTLSVANTGLSHSGGSQFFLNVHDNSFLDWFDRSTPSKHPVFGKAADTASYDVMLAISKVHAVADKPVVPVTIKSIAIMGT